MTGEGAVTTGRLVLSLCLIGILSGGAARAAAPDPAHRRYDDPVFCSGWLRTHADERASSDRRRHCVIAVATTYIDAEENSLPPESSSSPTTSPATISARRPVSPPATAPS
jgi:hypothetical protein